MRSALPILPILLLAAAGLARADGGAVIAQHQSGGETLTVFASPAPLRAGPSDISVMLQDSKTGRPILDRQVLVSVSSSNPDAGEAWIPPCCSMTASDEAVPATHAAAQNKLLYAANVIVPKAGPVSLAVRVGTAPPFIARLDAQPPLPPAAAYWPYLALPPVAIGLFALNRRARRR